MQWEAILNCVYELIRTYDPVKDSVDTHFQVNYGTHQNKNEKVFIQQCFTGCMSYKKFLQLLVKTILKINAASTNSADSIPFMVLSYLGLFRFEELGPEYYKKILATYEVLRVNTLCQFIFNPDILRDKMREVWMQEYDYVFIDNTIISGVEQNLIKIKPILEEIDDKATGGRKKQTTMAASQFGQYLAQSSASSVRSSQEKVQSEEEEVKKHTVPEPFNLTKPKIRYFPEPISIPKKVVVNQVPKSTKKPLLDKLKKKNEKRKEKVKEDTLQKYDFENCPVKRLFGHKIRE